MSEFGQVQIINVLKEILETLKDIQSKQDWFIDQNLQAFKSEDKFTVNDIRSLPDLTRKAYNQGEGNV